MGRHIRSQAGSDVIIRRERVKRALPGYVLGRELGAGSFGLVLAGRHGRLRRPVAIKVMDAEGPEGTKLDFAAEAQVLAGLDHPHVVRAFDYVEAEGLCLVVMELLGGGTLAQRRSGMSPEQACAVGLAVAAALDHAHGRGVLHRDIKADNILFAADGTVKVGDFGIAKLFEGSAATASGMAGTPMYMAPEQFEGGRLGPFTDLYALGIVLYQLLTGRAPFDPKQPLPVLWREHLTVPPPPMIGVPAPLEKVVLRALAKAPADRHPDATAFALDLAHAAADAYGPAWAQRSGWPLHLGDAVRRVTDAAVQPTRTADGGDDDSSGKEDGTKTVMSAAGGGSDAFYAGGREVGRRQVRRRRRSAQRRGVLLLAVLMAMSLVVWGVINADSPTSGAEVDLEAVSRRLAAAATETAAVKPDLARRLSVAAYRTAPTPQARDSVLRSFALTNRPRAVLTGNATAVAVAFSPDGRLLATTNGVGGKLQLWDAAARGQISTAVATFNNVAIPYISPFFSPDGRLLATISDTVQLWDTSARGQVNTPLTTFAVTGLTEGDDAISDEAFSPNGRLLATVQTNGTTRLWDTAARGQIDTPVATFPGDSVLGAVAFSPDGRLLATGGWGGAARVWDATARGRIDTALATLTGHTGHTDTVTDVRFSPDGQLLATSDEDGTARLWDTAARGQTDTPMATFTGHTGHISDMTFSPDGQLLTTNGRDGTIRWWDVTVRGGTDQPLTTLRVTTTSDRLSDFGTDFSPDGRLLATTTSDGAAQLWNAAARGQIDTPLATFPGGTALGALAFSPDGTLLATAHGDATTRIWDLDADRSSQDACAEEVNRLTETEWTAVLPDVAYLSPCP